jgi:hypothetical protein
VAVIGFPDPVDEVSARLVAGGVVVMAVVAVVLDQRWLLVPLAYGFWARVLTGPRLSPLGAFMTKVVRPRLALTPRPVAGTPKRFAQGVGAALTTAALVAWLAGGWFLAEVLLVGLVAAAFLESVLGICLGCRIYGACVVPLRHPARTG